jgi:kinesin family protein 22
MGHRIIEIEWSVKNNKEYVPSPRKQRKTKTSKQPRLRSNLGQEFKLPAEVDDNDHTAGPSKFAMEGQQRFGNVAEFGMEVTNTDSPNKSLSKRSFADTQEDRENAFASQTPQKRQKRFDLGAPIVNIDSEDDMEPPALAKKSRKKVAS